MSRVKYLFEYFSTDTEHFLVKTIDCADTYIVSYIKAGHIELSKVKAGIDALIAVDNSGHAT